MLLAEDLVQEWLITKKYFTVKNLKSTNNKELDLLGVKFEENNETSLIHVEVSVNYNPIGWFCNSRNLRNGNRTEEEIELGVKEWVERKFQGDNALVRNNFSPHANVNDWELFFVHGKLNDRNRRELEHMKDLGIKIKSIREIILDLQEPTNNLRTGGVGKDISDLITIYSNLE